MIYTDKIHPLGYLVTQEINLAQLTEDKADICNLREGAEVISVSVEILEKANTGTFDLGITDDTDFFLNDIDLTNQKIHKSSIETTIKADTELTIDTTAREGLIKVRLFYFAKGQIYA